MVVYFVDPRMDDMLRVIPVMNAIQDEYRRDAVVICAIAKAGKALTDSERGDAKLEQRHRELIGEMLKTRHINHTLTPKVIRADRLEFSEESLRPRLSSMREEFGFAIILSTDNRLRWLGNPYSEDLKHSLDKILAADPGIVARREAEKSKGGKGAK